MVSCMKTTIMIPQMAGSYKGVQDMWSAERWAPLDLRRRGELGPYDQELIVLHMRPKTDARSERYLVGRMEVCQGRTCFPGIGSGGTLVPANLRKHYDLRWIRLQEDGGEGL